MGSSTRRNPVDRLRNIRDARTTRRERIRELTNRPTTFYIDRDCIPENIIEALENRIQPPARVIFAPLEENIESDSDHNSDIISGTESSVSSDSESSESYEIQPSISLSDYEEWEARAEIPREETTEEEIPIEFTPSPSPLFVLPNDEESNDEPSENIIIRIESGISDDELLNILNNVDWPVLEEDDLS